VELSNVTEQRVLTPGQLAAEVRRLTATPAEWVARVRLDPEGRWYERIRLTDSCEVWLISWLPGQATGFHDHGGAAGAFAVVWGALDEYVAASAPAAGTSSANTGSAVRMNRVVAGGVRSFGPRHVHDVRNSEAGSVAVSVHAYSPPLSAMTRYNLTPSGLVVTGTEVEDDW
jgi:predicted metal-dependent enzyme (double-stranded beta helix superfamily)